MQRLVEYLDRLRHTYLIDKDKQIVERIVLTVATIAEPFVVGHAAERTERNTTMSLGWLLV